MKKKDLIKLLEPFDDDMEICLWDCNGGLSYDADADLIDGEVLLNG